MRDWISAGVALVTLAAGCLVLVVVVRGRLQSQQVPLACAGM